MIQKKLEESIKKSEYHIGRINYIYDIREKAYRCAENNPTNKRIIENYLTIIDSSNIINLELSNILLKNYNAAISTLINFKDVKDISIFNDEEKETINGIMTGMDNIGLKLDNIDIKYNRFIEDYKFIIEKYRK